MFTQAGTVMCEIDGVEFTDARFATGPSDFDICIHGKSLEDPNQGDWWRGEYSNNYGKGNFASMTQKEITTKTLKKIGFEGRDISKLKEQLMGKEIPFTIKASEKDGKTYYNVQYIGAGAGIDPIGIDVVKARIKALTSEKTTPPPKPEPVTETADDDDLPF